MTFEGFFQILSDLKKMLFIIVAVFGAGALVSFSYMGDVIKKIESDMFWRLDLPDRPDPAKQLLDISHNITSISNQLPDNNSIIAENLTRLSGEILNISYNLNLNAPNIVYLTPMEVLMLEFKMSLAAGILIVLPLILFYIFRAAKGRLSGLPFIRERKLMIFTAILGSVLLFLLGAGYAYYYMLPFFLSYIYQDAFNLGINANFSVYEFISFVILTTVIIGIAFELPVILTFLVHLGLLSRKTLANYRRHAYVLLLIIAAWVTPDPTMFTQIMVALPFIALYEASLVVMRLTGK